MKRLPIILATTIAVLSGCADRPANDPSTGSTMPSVAMEPQTPQTPQTPPTPPTPPTPTDTNAMRVTNGTPADVAPAGTNPNGPSTAAPPPPSAPPAPTTTGLTAADQGNGEMDRKITQQIRQAVMGDKSLSFMAKNVKIITVNGKVTLKGPVKSDQERASIEMAAKRVAGDSQVDNQLEITK